MREHENEPVPGLPEKLPAGEYIVWQGKPEVSALVKRVFHAPTIALYFAGLIAVHAVYQSINGTPLSTIGIAMIWQVGLAVIGVGLLVGAGNLYAHSTMYTFTNRRLVIRSGVAVSMMVNIPWESVKSAGVRYCRDGTGDFLITPTADRKLYYLMIWPHVRQLGFRSVQPLLRGIGSPRDIAARLGDVIRDQQEDPAPVLRPVKTAANGQMDQGANGDSPIPV